MKVSMNENHFIASKGGDGPNNYQYIYRYDSDQVDDDRLPILRTTSKVIHREEAFLPGKATLPHHVNLFTHAISIMQCVFLLLTLFDCEKYWENATQCRKRMRKQDVKTRLKAALPHPVFQRHLWTNMSAFKTQRFVEYACVNGMWQLGFKLCCHILCQAESSANFQQEWSTIFWIATQLNSTFFMRAKTQKLK